MNPGARSSARPAFGDEAVQAEAGARGPQPPDDGDTDAGHRTPHGTLRPAHREYRISARTMWHVVSDGG